MQFIIRATDGEGMLEKRMAVRPRHLEAMAAMGSRVVCAGNIPDENGRPKGSVVILDLEDRAALDEYLAREVYMTEGVWAHVEAEPLNVVFVRGEAYGK